MVSAAPFQLKGLAPLSIFLASYVEGRQATKSKRSQKIAEVQLATLGAGFF
jgi:hypothetical protein